MSESKIGVTSSFDQLINTIAHEYYHLLCHLSKMLDVEEEDLAQLNGYLNMRSYNIVENLKNKSRS